MRDGAQAFIGSQSLRRLELDVTRLPRVYADLALETSCTGTGRRPA